MAKLNVSGKAGFNAGENFYAKLVKIDDIRIDPEISKIFTRSDKIRDEIKAKIKQFGFDKSQPVTLWKGKNIIVDGHTRLEAARESKLDEIPAVEMEFETFDDAILYTFERQAIRRNLTPADILKAAQLIKGPKAMDGTGRAADLLAKRLGVSPAIIYQARKIAKEASEEDLEAIQKGEKSIKAVYNTVKKSEPAIDFTVTDAQSLPESVRFLKGAVVLLTETREVPAAKLLVNHFLKKHEKNGFYKLLPETCLNQLSADETREHSVVSLIAYALEQLKLLTGYLVTIESNVPKTILKTACTYLEEARKSETLRKKPAKTPQPHDDNA
jgi:ParB family chromosome partitioning protein